MGNELGHEISTRMKCHPIVELRQYTLHPGKRDVMIELFEREFIESQEVAGIQVIGQFRDLEDPDRFVWLRGFPDMVARAQSLHAFYTGDVWQKHRDAANATMIDSDNVLLLKAANPNSGFDLTKKHSKERGVLVAMIFYFDGIPDSNAIDSVVRVSHKSSTTGATALASFVTEQSPNNYPRLPVRGGENVFASFIHFADPVHGLEESKEFRKKMFANFARENRKLDALLLLPTDRSLVPGVY